MQGSAGPATRGFGAGSHPAPHGPRQVGKTTLLLELAADSKDNVVEVTHQELADMLGTWRETISKTLQDFRRRGLVASGRRRLTLLDKEGLELEAGLS